MGFVSEDELDRREKAFTQGVNLISGSLGELADAKERRFRRDMQTLQIAEKTGIDPRQVRQFSERFDPDAEAAPEEVAQGVDLLGQAVQRGQLRREQQQLAKQQAVELRGLQIEEAKAKREERELPFAQTRQAEKAKFQKTLEPPKATERQAAQFAKRLLESEEVFTALDEEGFDFTGVKTQAERLAPEIFKSGGLKRQQQAERSFVNAILRRESGAAIAPSEFASAEKQYFPQPGDDALVLEQKRRNRAVAIASMKAEAGEALTDVEAQLAQLAKPSSGGLIVEQEVGGQQVAAQPTPAPAQQAIPAQQKGLSPAQEQRRQELLRKAGL